jgi:hypothetical protein
MCLCAAQRIIKSGYCDKLEIYEAVCAPLLSRNSRKINNSQPIRLCAQLLARVDTERC